MKLCFLSLPAADYAASKHFYEHILALPVLRISEDGPHRFTDYDLGQSKLKVFEWTEPWYGGNYTSFMLETDNLDQLLEKVKSAGYEASAPEVTQWGGRIASIRDPFDNIINLLDSMQRGSA